MIPIDPTHPIIGFVGAGLSSLAFLIAQTAEPATRSLVEQGGTAGFIIGLSFGCVTLWKEVQTQRREMAELNKEIRSDWKTQNEKLIVVLERMEGDARPSIAHPDYPPR